MIVGQAEFTCALLNPKQATPAGLTDPKGRPAGKRFDVYRNNVVFSLLDAMETAFPVVQKLVGTDFFRAMAGIYVRKYPPKTPLLMFYGEDFPDFLAGFEPAQKLGYLPDVAGLELARRISYHAADSTTVSADVLGKVAPDAMMQARLTLAPAMQVLSSRYPIASIWEFNMIEGAAKPKPGGQIVLITRPKLDLDMQVVSPATGAFLQSLQNGRSLSDAHDAATAREPGFDLAGAIGLLLSNELINKTDV
ncbi:MAG: DUF2063 domain-containing protein [Rhodobacteraceae bacterium]|nr:DUF2063 domain-containing protein [Paracoccaceae bacterium]